MRTFTRSIQRSRAWIFAGQRHALGKGHCGLWRWHRDDMVWCLEQRDTDGKTPLMLAVRLGEARMVEWLEVQQRTTLWRFGETAQELVPLDEPVRRGAG